MKRIIAIAILFLGTILAFAQVPQKMSYQAVIKNASGDVLQNQNVAVKVSILQGSDSGTVVYSERLTGTTNSAGLLATEIGSGTVLSGNFGTIEWAFGNYWLKTETDPNGGTNYTIAGTSQLLSVPYAMYAKNAGNSVPGGVSTSEWTAIGDDIYNANSGNVGIGTTTPAFPLTVAKTGGEGIIQQSEDGAVKIGFWTNSGSAYVQTSSDHDLRFATNNGNAQMTLQKTTGNLGIGTTTPTEKLDVNGKTRTTNFQMTNGAGEGKVLTSDAGGNATWQTMKMPYSENIRFSCRLEGSGSTYTLTERYNTSNLVTATNYNSYSGGLSIKISFQKSGLYHFDFNATSYSSSTNDISYTNIVVKESDTEIISSNTVPYIVGIASFSNGFDYYVTAPKDLYIKVSSVDAPTSFQRINVTGNYISE
ncbi:MAG: hypothetical protein QM564_13170 [Bergeyella sp.]